MNPASALVFTKESYEKVRSHIFPGDGLEAAAILICARAPGPRVRLLVREVVLVPHEQCHRQEDFLRWPGMVIEDAIDLATAEDLSLVLLHSHPGGYLNFSQQDDRSDQATMPSIFQALGPLHGTAVMVPSGEVLARVYRPGLRAETLDLVTVAEDNIRLWWADGKFRKRPMAFGAESREEMARLSVVVLGASGTGSISIEQLARLGFGQVQMIDYDRIEEKNLNRILNAGISNIGELKVDTLAMAIDTHRGSGVAIPIPSTILDRGAVLLASQADLIFSCVDTQEGRQIADLMASAFLIPLFDVGVTIPTRRTEEGAAIFDVCARVDYVRPGGPTLFDRGVYTQEGLRAEHLLRTSQEQFNKELADGYIKGAIEQAPSVISLNMRASSDLILECIARLYPFRHDSNEKYARRELSIAAGEEEFRTEQEFATAENMTLARGDREPLIGLPFLLPTNDVA
jgi:hypothetical protein